MSKKPNIVNFERDSHETFVGEKPTLSNLVTHIKDLSINELVLLLNRMLDSADDKLFDMADKSNEVTFFNAMRQVRIKRQGLVNIFRQELEFSFKKQLGVASDTPKFDNVEAISLDSLSLVQEDDLEEDLAVDAMVNKGRNDNSVALEHICTRLDTLCPTVSVTQSTNPLDPRFIAEAFRTSSHSLELDVQSRLIVFKLFERSVIESLKDVYLEVNEEFAEKGVLPDLHKRRPRRVERERAKRESEDNKGQTKEELRDEVREEVFNTLRDLIGNRKVAYPEGTQVVETDQLVNALTNLQRDPGYSPRDLSTPEQVRHILGGFLPATQGHVNGGTIGNVNDDVIDIVTMLFDFILDDKNLHNDIKAMIARLQIPMLKVGLVDRTFFSDRQHPARKLLNELSRAGIGWVPMGENSVDPLLNKISQIVETITTEFRDDVGLFSNLLNDFEAFKSQDNKRTSILEKRMKEAEEGKAKADNARQKVNSEIARMCHGRIIAEPVKHILKEAWTNVLFLELLKPNNQEGWEKALKVAEFLVWSVQPKGNEEAKAKLKKIMVSLIKNLRLGMNRISFNSYRSSQLLEELEECHRKILALPLVTHQPQSDDSVNQPSPTETIGEAATEETVKELSLPISEPVQVKKDSTEQTPIEALEELQDHSDPVFETVEQLQGGSWLEMATVTPDEKQRCKLAAHIVSSDKYIFVNRTGMKLAELTKGRLAAGLKAGLIAILDDAALFDRALESVITNLRSMKEA
ncbi:DUF1631 domain-containing protein [Pleionea litopenaei]|uniref:DUF1631 domain-containing protein n=1 Tax=Pleionea litopenaei TaxID=3070815 RepID=A0AA51X7T3_9GAMM|nr:DUF1631 domain-containing protein [Pleionea sp. HL-JVS1]WMS88657.1 DUF1631 domain-containing protein [Pleionea sp. HL-JVS1]